MAQIVKTNDDKLILTLTEYGNERIAKAMSDPSVDLHITKIKLGSGENNEYYKADSKQTALKGDLGLEFYVLNKELLEDDLTISFYTIIPETVGGIDIREVGLYETVNGVDHLFAISSQQPFVKPTMADNYFISIDYYIFLKAQNFASVYSQITLDTEHALVTEFDLEEMMRTFLFSNANLINQIGNNSRIVGYNRATQLYDKINENKNSYSYITLYKNYSSFLGIFNPSNLFSFWAFDYSRRMGSQNSIVDLGPHSYNLSLTVPLASLTRTYQGFTSMFSFEKANFYLDASIPVRLYDDEKGEDIPFTMAFAVNPINTEENGNTLIPTRTLLAKSNESTKKVFEFKELSDLSLQIKLFTDNNNYLTFTSETGVIPQAPHAIVLSYDNKLKEFTVYINSKKVTLERDEIGEYTHMTENPNVLYGFECAPSFTVYTDSNETPTELFNRDGTPHVNEGWEEWSIEEDIVYFNNNEASYIEKVDAPTLYAWKAEDEENSYWVYTMTQEIVEGTQLYNEDYTTYPPDGDEARFFIEPDASSTTGYSIFYHSGGTSDKADPDPSQDKTKELYEYNYTYPNETIWANEENNPTALYKMEGEGETARFIINTDEKWIIDDGKIYCMGQEATRLTGEGSTIYTYTSELASYVRDNQGQIKDPIKSEVGIISIVKEGLSEERVRALALLLSASLGRNPLMNIN